MVWEGASEDSKMVKERVDSATGVRRPAFKRSYNPTMLGTNHVYHSVSMMMVGVVCLMFAQTIIYSIAVFGLFL